QLVIQQLNQLDATFSAGIAIVDLSAWADFLAAEASVAAADHRVEDAERVTAEEVVMRWYQLVASRQLVRAARETLITAQEILLDLSERVAAGTTPVLDEVRARAEVRRAEQSLADAELQAVLAERDL